MLEHPDVLVLGGGGVLGEAWMTGVLAGLHDATGFDPRTCDGYVGTSAGSIVAAALVAGVEPGSRLEDFPAPPPVPESEAAQDAERAVGLLEAGLQAGEVVARPLAWAGLRATERAGAALRRLALSRMAPGRRSLDALGREIERVGTGWDGRLAVSAVELESGRRVMFGSPGAPPASVGDAVQASCAIPGVFRPVVVDGRSYVDGGVWSPTNLDCARVGRGTRVLCLNPTGSMRPNAGSPFGVFGPLSRSVAAVEAMEVRRRGARVEVVSPDAASVAAMGPRLMDPRGRAGAGAAGVAQGRALAR